ncbi:hypothetical protein [Streptomyces virginiae]|uniref:hypothetical protein n=1 Tax=Streptomyces virginiae TaxID=1961 RepID=UPI00225845CD|nr:hypothetical protein [Streptomyces virginiae]MCX5181082.1 hypothetical protein [Streptomyces virginiae]
MNRSREAIRLAEHLSQITAIHVELAHDSGARWVLRWHDGPLREEMRAHLDAALADSDRYAAMRDRTIGCSRLQTRQAWAARATAARRENVLAPAIAESAVHKGEQESDEASALWLYVRRLWENTSYPERVGAPEDAPLIEQLVAASTRDLPSGSRTTSELYMAQALLAK